MSRKTAEKKAVARKDMTKWQWTWKEMKRNKVAYLLVAPYMLIFTCVAGCSLHTDELYRL